jgi:hypothetical protein
VPAIRSQCADPSATLLIDCPIQNGSPATAVRFLFL